MINRPGISSITIGGVTQYGGSVEFAVPGATIDPETGSITIPTGAGQASETFVLTPTNISNGYILLNVAPVDPAKTRLEAVGYGPMYYGPDFTVTSDDGGKRVSWVGKVLQSLLESGETIIIYYS